MRLIYNSKYSPTQSTHQLKVLITQSTYNVFINYGVSACFAREGLSPSVPIAIENTGGAAYSITASSFYIITIFSSCFS